MQTPHRTGTSHPSTELTVAARDGYPLAADLFDASEPRATVIINSAVATPARFYRRFATALAEAGYDAVTWDYRGIGRSRPERLRDLEVNVRDWALLDMEGGARLGAATVVGPPALLRRT